MLTPTLKAVIFVLVILGNFALVAIDRLPATMAIGANAVIVGALLREPIPPPPRRKKAT